MNQINSRHRRAGGFTLIELLVVMSIIVILAGIGLAVSKHFEQKSKIEETSVRIQRIRMHLEEYINENGGIYPQSADGTSTVLYRVLSGDFTGQGQPPTGTTYYRELTELSNSSLVGILGQNRVILDAFGSPFRYRPALDANGNVNPNVRNDGDFDLWSVGPDKKPSEMNIPGNLFTEETQDDIWK